MRRMIKALRDDEIARTQHRAGGELCDLGRLADPERALVTVPLERDLEERAGEGVVDEAVSSINDATDVERLADIAAALCKTSIPAERHGAEAGELHLVETGLEVDDGIHAVVVHNDKRVSEG